MNTESAASSPRPIVAHPGQPPITATGRSLIVQEWSGSGPDYLHVHRRDDEAWHVLEGTLQFEFMDESVEATPGNTVFVPAGVPHTYREVVPLPDHPHAAARPADHRAPFLGGSIAAH